MFLVPVVFCIGRVGASREAVTGGPGDGGAHEQAGTCWQHAVNLGGDRMDAEKCHRETQQRALWYPAEVREFEI